jgi:hypothetical protein
MTAQPRKYRDQEPQLADSSQRTQGPLCGDDIVAGTASRVGRGSHGRWLAYFVVKAVQLTGRSRDLLYDQMRLGYLTSVMVGRRHLSTRRHLQQLYAIAS